MSTIFVRSACAAGLVLLMSFTFLGLISANADESVGPAPLRAPAYPLVVHDPYFSIWSFTDDPGTSFPRHWTGRIHAITAMVKIDGTNYRLLGQLPKENVTALTPKSIQVLPTRTIYTFTADDVEVKMQFTSPVLPDDLMILSRPVTYLAFTVRALDEKPHDVKIYYDNSAELVVNDTNQLVAWGRPKSDSLTVMRMGTVEQPILEKKGDGICIDWGYLFVAVPKQDGFISVFADDETARDGFTENGTLPETDDVDMPRPCSEVWPMITCLFDLPAVDSTAVSRRMMIAYDDEYSINYLGQKLRPFWRKDGAEIMSTLELADRQFESLLKRCEEFDEKLISDAEKVGGPRYAQLLSLAYRHAMGAHKLTVLPNGEPMFFSKECYSNGCIGTVDLLYPAAPLFALMNVELLKGTTTPILEYVQSGRWKFPYSPHDLGTYPLATGQVYGGGERDESNQMPVEESGNMIITLGLIARVEGNAEYARKYWPIISQWAEYLKNKGFDPENQLCTDDFAGHLAHNVNLSAKAIVALGVYAQLCTLLDKPTLAEEYRAAAESYAKQWVEQGLQGDHYGLAFDRPDTWSLKYNLVWDKLLHLNLFPESVYNTEIQYYKTKINEFGIPLDNRSDYTKLDWELWVAAMADNREDFDTLMAPVYNYVDKTPSRVPMSDWYYSSTAKMVGFQARPVIGALFIKMLEDPQIWNDWASRAKESIQK